VLTYWSKDRDPFILLYQHQPPASVSH